MNEFGRIAIVAIGCIAIAALLFLAANVMGVPIPSWLITAFWIVLAAVGLIYAIKLIMGIART